MSVVTLRPTSTVSGSGSTIGGGAASRHAALADDSDATYIDVSGAYGANTVLGFTAPSLPAGAVVTGVKVRARFNRPAGSSGLGVAMSTGDGGFTASGVTPGLSIITAAVLTGPTSTDTIQIGLWKSAGTVSPRIYELYVDVTYSVLPVVDVTAPSGTYTDENSPLVEWTGTFDGTTQSGYASRIFSAAQYGAVGFDPATSAAIDNQTSLTPEASWQPGILPNGTYRAYVAIADRPSSEDRISAYDYSQFTINVSPPAAPTTTFTDDPTNGRVAIAVASAGGGVSTNGFLVERSIDGGDTWETVEEVGSGSPTTVYDYFAPSGIEIDYRASAWHDTTSGQLFSAYTTGSVTPAGGWWLKHPTSPSLNYGLVKPKLIPGYSQEPRQTALQALGRSDAVLISDTPGPETGSITFEITGQAAHDALRELLAEGSPLLLASNDQEHWRDRWVGIGSRSATRIIDKKFDSPFDVEIQWTEVARPEGV